MPNNRKQKKLRGVTRRFIKHGPAMRVKLFPESKTITIMGECKIQYHE